MTRFPADVERLLGTVPTQLHIGGAWRPGHGNARMAVEDPATGRVLAEVALASRDDALEALAAADEAGPSWRAWSPRDRSDVLRRAFEAVRTHEDELALLVTLEMGKPLPESLGEVRYAADFLRWYAEEAVRINGRYTQHEQGDGRILTMREPVGPSLLITPWNFPIAMGTRKIAPALAAGCTTITKPAPQTPLSMLRLAQILQDAGVPPGVVNVINVVPPEVPDTMRGLIEDPRLRKVSFTGSTGVGRVLLAKAGAQVLRTSMELGGNAPFLVLEGADLDAALDGAMVAKMRNGGAACTSANRFLVHESLVAPFAEQMSARMGALAVGRGTEPGIDTGPLVDEGQRAKVEELVEGAVAAGASLLVGGERPSEPRTGYFYLPTVLADVPAEAGLLDQEIFGPVAPIVAVRSDDEAVAIANATEAGLVAYVYGSDLRRTLSVVEALEVGMVGVNRGIVSYAGAPFGGVKLSGVGREGGPEGIEEYLETKYAAISMG